MSSWSAHFTVVQPPLTTHGARCYILVIDRKLVLQVQVMTRHHSLVFWSARILGIAVCVFLGAFALDAWEPGKPVARTAADFLVHLLPSAILLTIVAMSWRRPWIGGVAFLVLAVVYAAIVGFRVDWVLAISGPLLIVGLLFLWSWRIQPGIAAG